MTDIRNGEHFANMREAYPALARTVLGHGQRVSPRGYETRELLDWSFVIDDPADALPVGVGRSLSLPFAAIEAIQLISGTSAPELLTRINPTMERFLSEREERTGHSSRYQHGAYGPRVGPYLEKVVHKLRSDQDTRQALLTVWSPRSDYVDVPDIPCTLSLHFMVRDERLLLLTTMRSNDIWWGTAYDVFQFTQLQLSVARVLDLPAGPYRHRANSLHVYERDYGQIENLTNPGDPLPFHPVGVGTSDTIGTTMMRAQSLISGAQGGYPCNLYQMTPSEAWYDEQLRYASPRAS